MTTSEQTYKERYERACEEIKRISRKQAKHKREIRALIASTSDDTHKHLRNAAANYRKALSKIGYDLGDQDPVEIARTTLRRYKYRMLFPPENGS